MVEEGRTEKEWFEECGKLNDNPIINREYKRLQAEGKVGNGIFPGERGEIPIIYARGKSLAEAWENSMICLWKNGTFVRTQYDTKDKKTDLYIEPPAKDATMITVVEEPLSDPMIHRAFPGGLEDLEEYRQEVCDGIKDHWVRNPDNPEDERWEYTYHGRLFNYDVPGLEGVVDQFEEMAQGLAKSPITRRAQMITWKPWEDLNIHDPACLQSFWGRMLRDNEECPLALYSDEKTGKLKLNMNMRFRSRDSYDAAFMNDFAFVHLIQNMADRISEIRQEPVKVGRFMDMSDSYHIYGKRFNHFLDNFVEQIESRDFEDRTWDREFAQEFFDEAKPMIKAKIEEVDSRRE